MEKDEIKQYADDTYGQVSSWINNCDSKASILLALIGVILSIAFTSDKLLGGILALTKDVVSLIKGEGTSCACASLFILVVLGIAIGFLLIASEICYQSYMHVWMILEMRKTRR